MTDEEEREKNRYFFTMEGDRIVQVDSFTGDTVAKEPRLDDGFIPTRGTFHPEYHLARGKKYQLTDIMSDLICGHVINGRSFAEIGRMPGMPSYGIIARWRDSDEDFNQNLKTAIKHRGSQFRDKIADGLEATKNLSKEDIPADKAYFEKAKWLAEKDDPDSYGPRTKVTGDADNPVIFRINTGIDRGKPVELDLPTKIEPRTGDIDVEKP